MLPSDQKVSPVRVSRARLAVGVLAVLGVTVVTVGSASAQYRTRSEFVPTFSSNTRVKQQMARLGHLAEQKQWNEWIAAYQQLVDDPRDLVVAKDDEFLIGVRYQLHQQLAGLPANVRQLYRQTHDNDARKIYDKALQANDAAGMRDVYSRYRFSSYANRALLWLGNQSLDQGRPEMARLAYQRLAKEPGAGAGLLFRYALAADAAGRPAEARAALERVRKEFPAEPLQLAGQNTTGAEAAAKVAQSLRKPAASPARHWTSFSGEAGDRKFSPGPTGGLKRLWVYTQPTSTDTGRPTSGVRFSLSASGFTFLSFPAVSGDRAWIQGPRNLSAVNLEDGKAIWDDQGWKSSPDEQPQQLNQVRGFRSYSTATRRPIQAAPAVEGNTLVSRLPLVSADGSIWPVDLALAAYDTRTGRQLWRRVAGGESLAYFWNLPAIQSGVVFSGVNSIRGNLSEYSAVALDASTGEPLWTTYLGGGSDTFQRTDGSPAAVRDGVVWIESTLYTLNAVDLLTGELRMIYRYTPERRSVYSGRLDSGPTISNEPISLVATGRGPVLFAPRWGADVVALDPAANGRLLWSSPKAGSPNASASLIGTDGQRVYIWGDEGKAINIADGRPVWQWSVPDNGQAAGSPGMPALCGDRLYVPVRDKLYVLSTADRKELEVLDLTTKADDFAGSNFWGVMAVDGMLLAMSDERVIAYGPPDR